WVDGRRVESAPLADGAVVQLGSTLVRVHQGALRVTRGSVGEEEGLFGISDAMAALRKELATVAPHPTAVMVLGETGTGKELVSRAVHGKSGRGGALVAVNCGALTDELLASELFGHVRGAFTGAVKDKVGLIEAAAGGTLVLDELGDASPRLQAGLLRVIEESRYRPVGATDSRPADVRWVAAAQPAIEQRVADGDFRLDLWTRLARWVLRAPPLRDRPEDVPLLAATFAAEIAPGTAISAELAQALMRRAWPGNVRELRSAVERLIVSAGGSALLEVQPWLTQETPLSPR
ncbi:MAG: sigma-54-dependent Fis family transcriptional regulator, partial [Myxococcales bacterium]|nr:sigma-54-dependent Fis family transcriptional regulator [Myxococcales bacterium]